MRFRLGFLSGFASGYYLGARAGRERYEQINEMLRNLRSSDTFEAAASTARDVMDRGGDTSASPEPAAGGSADGAPATQTAAPDSPAASFAPYAVDSPTEEG